MTTADDTYAVLIGLDWADQKHDLDVLVAGERRSNSVQLSSEPEAIQEWFSALHARFPKRRIAVCLEQSRIGITYGLMVGLIRVLNKAIAEYDKQIKTVFDSHPDAYIYASFPGAGAQLQPRLLAAFGTDRDRYASALEISTYSGVAPITETSGKRSWVHWRWHCPKFLRQSFVEFAAKSVGQSAWCRSYYDEQIKDDKGHHAVIRALAFKWQRIMFRCWQDRTPYDEAQYLRALKKRGSWLAEVPAKAS